MNTGNFTNEPITKRTNRNITKNMKKTLALILLGGLFATAAHAATKDLYLTGSTAFRANAYRAIKTMYGNNLTDYNSGTSGSPADLSGANRITFTGQMTNVFGIGTIVNIHCNWTGSQQGVQDITQGNLTTYFTFGTGSTTNALTHAADFCLSDVAQATTFYQTPVLDEADVAIVVFAFVKSLALSANTNVSNITMQQIQTIMANGRQKLSLFTGNTATDTNFIFYVGRTTDSGTRLAIEADSFFSGTPKFYGPTGSGSANWVQTNGYASGSGVANALKVNATTNAIGYLGISDASGVNSGLNIIAYNGSLPYKGTFTTVSGQTNDYSPVINGQYSYWSVEKASILQGSIGGDPDIFRASFLTNMDNDISTIFPNTVVRLSQMKVHRQTDGAPPTP